MNRLFTRLHGTVRNLVLAGFVLGLSSAAVSQTGVQNIPSTPTDISGSAERMISYRHQNHMWQTADGATHALVNVGGQANGTSLRLYTSVNNGVSWVGGPELPVTDDTSTSDGFLMNNNLFVTYSTTAGGVAFSQLRYDAGTTTWVLGATEMAYQVPGVRAINPTVARDAQGRHWVGFTSQDSAGFYNIKMVLRASAAQGWVDTGFLFGPSDNLSIERSARLVTVAGGVGMVYTVHQDVFWAKRQNNWLVTQPWSRSQAYVDRGVDNDPFGSHFSVTVDAQNNVHMAMVDGGQMLYLRLANGSQTWAPPKVLTKPVRAAYVQILSSGSTLMFVGNDKSSVVVFQSTDGGTSWTKTHLLIHPSPDGTTDYSNPRMELPGNDPASPVPVLQQYREGETQRTMAFQVPVTPAP
jgi:hypothetical protein